MIQILVFTDGRRDCIVESLPSFRKNLRSTHDMHWTVVNDLPDADYGDWIKETFPWVNVVSTAPSRQGFGGSIRRGWSLVQPGMDYIFHLEDDFVLEQELDLDELIRLIEQKPYLAQIVLKRQPWSPEEKAAGGITEMWPDLYEDKTQGRLRWTEHTLFFSTNPCLYRTALTELDWPVGRRSEEKFTQRVLKNSKDWRFAFWGHKSDDPIVTHIGDERVGTGY